MVKTITSKGALQAAIDIVLLAVFFIGGVAGVMYASVLTSDLTMWFYFAAGLMLLFNSLELVTKVTKPLDSYDTKDVV